MRRVLFGFLVALLLMVCGGAAMAQSAAPNTGVGIGVTVETIPEGARVLVVLPGGGAASVGLKQGDKLVGIDGRKLDGLPLERIAEMVRGAEKTLVRVDIVAPDGAQRTVIIPRLKISDFEIITEASERSKE